jgi:hypothetical protein
MSTPSPRNETSISPRLLRPLAASLAFTSAGSLSASIVYNNTPIGGGTGPITYDFAVDPGNDFTLNIDSTNGFKPVGITPLTGAALTPESALNDEIGSSSSFTPSWFSVPDGQHYYGFSLTDGTTVYGWMSITRSGADSTLTGTVTEWAYETSGESILVGQTSAIPEPATTAAAAALLAGSAAVWKRRRQKLAALKAA